MNKNKSAIITCDIDGKIKSFDKNAELLFGYSSEEVIKTKRIYNLLHSDFILTFADELNLFLNKKKTKFKKNFICLNSDNIEVPGELTVHHENNKLLITFVKNNTNINVSSNKSSMISKINLILRSKFIIGSAVPFLFSIIWSIYRFNTIDYKLVFFIFIAICLLHACANSFYDFFDWKSGRDKTNLDYVLFSTGGSRAIDFKFISEKRLSFISL